jgi:hypothetical protein
MTFSAYPCLVNEMSGFGGGCTVRVSLHNAYDVRPSKLISSEGRDHHGSHQLFYSDWSPLHLFARVIGVMGCGVRSNRNIGQMTENDFARKISLRQ